MFLILRKRRCVPRFGVNFLYFLALLLCGMTFWAIIHTSNQKDLGMLPTGLNSHFQINFNRGKNLADNVLVKKKIDEMKRELNDSTLNNEAMFPANRIGHFILVNPDLCTSSDHINIIIIVHTAPTHFEQRQRIRNSYGNQHLFQPFKTRVAFLLGSTTNKTLETTLRMEYARYNDTVMGDFIDDYHNLSLKGVMGYHWVSQYCPNSDVVLKTDDDVIVNMFKLLYSFLPHMLGKKKSIFCNVWYKGTMPILREGKWKVESHVFSSLTRYPYDYCSGFVVLMTTDLMGSMYEAARITPFFWIDDIYLFGMLPSVVGGVTYYNYALNSNVTLRQNDAINCTLSYGPRCPIFATVISGQSYWKYWDIIKDSYIFTNWTVNSKVVD